MHTSTDLATRFGVSVTTIRRALRAIGKGVGTQGKYEFTDEEINDIVDQLRLVLNKPVSTTTTRPMLVVNALLANKRNIILILITIVAAAFGIDLGW